LKNYIAARIIKYLNLNLHVTSEDYHVITVDDLRSEIHKLKNTVPIRYLFCVYIREITTDVTSCSTGCHIGGMPACILMHAMIYAMIALTSNIIIVIAIIH